jgi:hypothetical protein
MSNYAEIYEQLAKSSKEKREKELLEIKRSCVQLAAYFLAKKDNFTKSPEYYWLEAERKL